MMRIRFGDRVLDAGVADGLAPGLEHRLAQQGAQAVLAADAALGAHEQRDRRLRDATESRRSSTAWPTNPVPPVRKTCARPRSVAACGAVTEPGSDPARAWRSGWSRRRIRCRAARRPDPRSVRPPRGPPAPPNTKVSKKLRSSAGDSSAPIGQGERVSSRRVRRWARGDAARRRSRLLGEEPDVALLEREHEVARRASRTAAAEESLR